MRRVVAFAFAVIVVVAVGLIVGILTSNATTVDKSNNNDEDSPSDGGGSINDRADEDSPSISAKQPPTFAPTIIAVSIACCKNTDESRELKKQLPPGNSSCDLRFCEQGQTTAKSVAISGDLIAVGTVQSNSLVQNGSVTVYARKDTTPSWEVVARLVPEDGHAAWFGWSVAVADGAVAVGRPTNKGLVYFNAVYLFQNSDPKTPSNWREVAVLQPPEGSRGVDFGWSLAMAQDHTIAVGAKDDGSGSVFVFRPQRGGDADPRWIEEARVVPSDWEYNGNANFGFSVALSKNGEFMIVGAPSAGMDVYSEGLAYVFRRDKANGTWEQEARLRPTAKDGYRVLFGWSVAMDDDDSPVVAVGAPGEENNRGAVYLYVRSDGGNWEQETIVFGKDFRDDFGKSVAFSSSGTSRKQLFVGATQESKYGIGYVDVLSSLFGNDGSDATPWVLSETLVPEDQEGYSKFGSSLAIGCNTAVLGAELGNFTDSSSSYGSAYVTSAC